MQKNLPQLFKQELDMEIPAGLFGRVVLSIEKKAAQQARQERYIWGAISFFSLSAFVFSVVYATKAFGASNFSSYLSLVFSDANSISLLWRDLGLSLVESLPIFGVTLFLASIFVLLWSVRKFSTKTTRFVINANARIA